MEYKDWTIAECIKKVNDSLFLPDIQRPYVWNEDDVYLLFDSICRDYPINTVLFWFLEKNTLENAKHIKRIRFINQRFEENSPDTGPLVRDNYYLAIDGQQRITSLFLTLRGTYQIKSKKGIHDTDLYFNFLSGIEENEKEMLFDFQFFPQNHPDVWTEVINDKKRKPTVSTKSWIRVKYITGLEKLDEIQSIVKNKIKNEIDYNVSDRENGNIFKLWAKLNFNKLITFYEERTQEYDKVLDIFIRTNSGGQKLSYSDLLFSFIKLNWTEARDKFKKLLKELNEGTRYKFTHDVILKSILFFHATDQDGMKYRTENFTPHVLTKTKVDWDEKIERAYKVTKDLLSNTFLLTHDKLITSYNAIIPIVYFIYKHNIKSIGEESGTLTPELQSSIREWLITSMLTGVFGGQSDGILNKAKKAIEDSSSIHYFPSKELFENFKASKPALTLAVTKDLIDKASYNSHESYLVLSLLYNHSINFLPKSKDNLPQQDHVISQGELKKAKIPKDKINSIFNLRYVTSADNRKKSDESFSEWYDRLGDSVLEKHYIPNGNWNALNYDEFLNKREVMFLQQIGIE